MFGLYVVAVLTRIGQTVDTNVMTSASASLGGLLWGREILSLISPVSFVLATVAIATAGYSLHGVKAAAKAVGAVVITVGSAYFLKIGLPRPDLADSMSNSWPSGHVAVVASLTVGAMLAVPSPLRKTVALVGGALVAFTSLATLTSHWHRPSDMIASALLAAAVGLLFGYEPLRSSCTDAPSRLLS